MLPNMSKDWRFAHSPHVEIGGLRSYAGTPLLCKTASGGQVALGSLCVASNEEGLELSSSQAKGLIRSAEMLSDELINRVRLNRQAQRRLMADLITDMQQQANVRDIRGVVKGVIESVYPECKVSFQTSYDGHVHLTGRPPMCASEAENGLWEDVNYVEQAILESNHTELIRASQTVRAIVQHTTVPEPLYMVVDSMDIQQVFDDIDSWFVEKCAAILCSILQQRVLDEALQAKDNFLRGITHQLRTPIHGVLGSCELLGDELNSSPRTGNDDEEGFRTRATAILNAINSSGQELMVTVNNILRLNRWSEITGEVQKPEMCDLYELEEDVNHEVSQRNPPSKNKDIFVLFESRLEPGAHLLWIDKALLKECLQALVCNGVQHTIHGGVTIRTTYDGRNAILIFDVIDTGCGISPEDWQRIFEPYEKGDNVSAGAGVGLTLASRVAAQLGGKLSMMASEKGKGSHFRLELYDPILACGLPPSTPSWKRNFVPRHYREVSSPSGHNSTLGIEFARFLDHGGLTKTTDAQTAINIFSHAECSESDDDIFQALSKTSPDQATICLLPSDYILESLQRGPLPSHVMTFAGPFLSRGLEEILQRINDFYKSKYDACREDGNIASPLSLEDGMQPMMVLPDVIPAITETPTPRALLVDDNPINLRIIRMYCERRGIQNVTAEDGLQAVQAFESAAAAHEPFNLILMDLQMPHCDGAHATEQIRVLEQKMKCTPANIFIRKSCTPLVSRRYAVC